MLEYQRLQFFQNHLHFSRPSKDVCFWSGQTRRSFYEASEVGQKEIQSTGSRWARKSTSRCKMKICSKPAITNRLLEHEHTTFIKETFIYCRRWWRMLQSFDMIFDKCNLEMTANIAQVRIIWDGTSWSGFPELVPTLLKLELVAKLLLFWVSEMTGHVGPGWLVINWKNLLEVTTLADSGFVGCGFSMGVSKNKGTYPKMDGL